METATPNTTSSGPEKAPRQVKSKHKSRSGCQACKLRRLKCGEEKPQCRNCQKKGQECPGYTLRLQWSTKYERPREPARPEPTNFDELVSAVTQSIVPGGQGQSAVVGRHAKSAATPPTDSSGAGERKPVTVSVQSNTTPRSVASPTAMTTSPFPPGHLEAVSVNLVADAAQPDYSSLATGYVDFDTNSMMGGASASSGSLWGSSRKNSPAPAAIECLVALASSEDVEEPETSLNDTRADITVRPGRPAIRFGQFVPPPPQLARPLVDIPSFLIQHWFKSVCSSWSAFDNQGNPYRQLSASLWHSSMAVFYAMQSMAAASLVEHLPHLKGVCMSAPRLATQAIAYEFQSFRASSGRPLTFPGGLVLSLFCMSSSTSWSDSRQLGLQFLKPGRAVLNCLNKYASALSATDRELLNFFNGCLIYEEMLRSIVSNDETDMENLAVWKVSSAQPISVVPHAWTGVSPDLLRLFGKTMFLCRRSRNRWRQAESVSEKILGETADYEDAVAIEEVLLGTEVPELSDDEGATEEAALKRHLHDAAEAYRLSSVLQLYQTFPNLIARRLPGLVDMNGYVPYSGWLSPLALHITNILRNIPPSSSMRCLQPLLCLCAGTGLRYDNVDPLIQTQSNPFAGSAAPSTPGPGFGLDSLGTTASPDVFGMSTLSTTVIGENDLEIASARRFLMERLGRLEQSLPPKPIQVEKQLLKSIWATYDAETVTLGKTHWLDVMVNNGLESVFG